MGVMLSISAEATGQKAVLQTFSAALFNQMHTQTAALCCSDLCPIIALSDMNGKAPQIQDQAASKSSTPTRT